jgi:hypothetical protein
MPHVRKLDVRTPSDNPNEIVVSVSIPRATVNFRSIDNSLPELEQELAERYPVKRVRRSRRKRNPADPTHWELNCIVELARPLVGNSERGCPLVSEEISRQQGAFKTTHSANVTTYDRTQDRLDGDRV